MGILKDCEDALGIAVLGASRGDAKMADVLEDVLRGLKHQDFPLAMELSAVAHFGLAKLDTSGGRHQAASERRERAVALLDRAGPPGETVPILDMIADELMAMGENRKALAYCNRSVELSRDIVGLLGARLFRAGRCHRRVGFADAARDQLREAIPLLRSDPRIPFLPHALLELGIAAYKSAPQEGADALREAAALFEANGDASNEGIAWLNLGVALSHAGELDGAIAAYERTRAIRDRNPKTTPAQRGNLHNNLAGAWRRKRDFARARAEAGKALDILKTVGGEFYAHALGTTGEIARDEGQKQEALAWFAEARTLFERLPGVGVDKLATMLENEAEALAALGRVADAARLQARGAALRGQTAPPAPEIPLDKVRPNFDEIEYEGAVVIALDDREWPEDVCANCGVVELETLLERRLAETGVGEIDGHLTGPGTMEIYLVGPDARDLFEAVAPMLRDYPLCEGATIQLRQGEAVESFALAPKLAH